jgi:alpha/beta superfamily hydrolase
MKQHTFIFITFIIGITTLLSSSYAQTPAAVRETPILLQTASGSIEGTLTLPEKNTPIPVALIIAGSGPTDRNGNNPTMHNGSLRMLADSLAKYGIASVRYDKRGVGASAAALKAE